MESPPLQKVAERSSFKIVAISLTSTNIWVWKVRTSHEYCRGICFFAFDCPCKDPCLLDFELLRPEFRRRNFAFDVSLPWRNGQQWLWRIFSSNSENMARWGDVTINHKSHKNESWGIERIDLETSQELTRPEGLLAAAMLDRSMVRVSRVSTSSTEFVWEKISKPMFWMIKKGGSVCGHSQVWCSVLPPCHIWLLL